MNDPDEWAAAVLQHRHVMSPIATDVVPQLNPLVDVQAVVFDVYGTLVISGSGDVGSADKADRGSHIEDALGAVGLHEFDAARPSIEMLHAEIGRLNDARRSDHCPKPEVDIVEAWRFVLERCGIDTHGRTEQTVRLAAQYEARANPTWPMPGSVELLNAVNALGIPMGIVSNAQTFTPPLVQDLLAGQSIVEGGFDLNLCVFSNRFRQAKPGPRLFDALRVGLSTRGIAPHHAVYVGNDMLNDVWAASQAGLQTAWFAGDLRSCRPRQDDPRCRSLRPDVVLTNLGQLLECLAIQ